ncbi:MAG: hypothetical protein R2729_15080 [Bryobacteraceae bacterium]
MNFDSVVYAVEQRAGRFHLIVVGINAGAESILFEKPGLNSLFAALREAERWCSANSLRTADASNAGEPWLQRVLEERGKERSQLAGDAVVRPPRGVRVAAVTPNSVTLEWETTGDVPGTQYDVEVALSSMLFRGNPMPPATRDLLTVAHVTGQSRYTHRFDKVPFNRTPVLCRLSARRPGGEAVPGDEILLQLA